jgi:hypothetical protein
MEEDGDPKQPPRRTVLVEIAAGDEDAARIEAISKILMSDSDLARHLRQMLEDMLSQPRNAESDENPG